MGRLLSILFFLIFVSGCHRSESVATSRPVRTQSKAWVLHEDGSEWCFANGQLVPTHDAVEREQFDKAFAVAWHYVQSNHLDWGGLEIAMARRTEFAIVFCKDLDPRTNNGASGNEHEINVDFDGKITWIGVPEM